MSINPSRGHYVDGRWLQTSGSEFNSINPADDTLLWQGTIADKTLIHRAYQAASRAQEHWRQGSLDQRRHYIQKFVDVVLKKLPELATILSQETGQPLWEATASLKLLQDKLHYSTQAYEQRTHTYRLQQGSQTLECRFQPLGVAVVLGAFNLPIHLSHGHMIPALLAGNTVILKPSELTPYISEAVMQCWHEADLPAGVINMIQGNAQTAIELINQPIQAVYFTGSYTTGMAISSQCKHRPEVLLALEMGGNNPLIIEPVDDQSAAIYHTLVSAFITAGQRCSCTRRLILPNQAWGRTFLENLIQQTQALLIDRYDATPPPFLGPMIRRSHAQHALDRQNKLIHYGAKPRCPMNFIKPQGAFVSPGILDMKDATWDADEEIFAPLIKVYWYDDFAKAIELANATSYGLAAGLISDQTQSYDYFLKHIRAGVISWNRATTQASSQLPFGGIGHSGNHRPSAFFASDYCVYPMACMEEAQLQIPDHALPGVLVQGAQPT